MTKAGIFASLSALLAALAFAMASPADADDACQHKDFKTKMVKEACTKGGQKAAKDAMKQFMKDAKIKSCNQCHSKLAPNYENKPDALDQFKKAGGELVDDKK
jgi:hypothetical protein